MKSPTLGEIGDVIAKRIQAQLAAAKEVQPSEIKILMDQIPRQPDWIKVAASLRKQASQNGQSAENETLDVSLRAHALTTATILDALAISILNGIE